MSTPDPDQCLSDLLDPTSHDGAAFLAALSRAREAHPAIFVEAAAVARHLVRVCDASTDRLAQVLELRLPDLYLACACTLGTPAAIARFEALYLQRLRTFVRQIDAAPAQLDELKQRLRERVLVAQPGALPRIATYSGAGSLGSWVAIAARRLALASTRGVKPAQQPAEAVLAEQVAAGADAELDWARAEHAEAFRAALQTALKTLSARDRLLLRLHFVDGVSVTRIAASYGVSQSTVSRWLARAREHVRDEALRTLQASGHLNRAEFESLARVLQSRLELSISSVLGGDPSAAALRDLASDGQG
ncbi:MAG TPA: sigma-70 family RNA polymerase sigma factor [Polyangiaceae bacterium]|jgi:RNA polymerase sigma-70 factor (ECF subfamily)|nr:sigma-70 family RNA polymerase sigma factor [Polyangiaceae bacterium]